MIKALSFFLSVILFVQNAWAGGTIPDGLGAYDDGRSVNMIPAYTGTMRFAAYGSILNVDERDYINYAVATVDIETRDWAFLYSNVLVPNQVQIWLSGKSDPTSAGCLDNIPTPTPATPCNIATTDCLAKVKQGKYDFCSEWRTSLRVNNIRHKIQTQNLDAQETWEAIVRHEVAHIMGLAHGMGGPMADGNNAFTPCHHALWSMFNIDPEDPNWVYLPTPPECD